MKQRILIAGGVLVALLVVGLLWAVSRSSDAPAVGATSVATPDPVVAPPVTPAPATPAPVTTVPGPTPAPTPVADTPTPPAPILDRRIPDPNREVHDHSGEENKGRPSPLEPDTIFAVRQAFTPLVKSCASSLAGAGSNGQVTVVARLTIAGGKLSAEPPKLTHPKFKDEAFDDCIINAFAQLQMAAPGSQTDTSYRVAMPFDLP